MHELDHVKYDVYESITFTPIHQNTNITPRINDSFNENV